MSYADETSLNQFCCCNCCLFPALIDTLLLSAFAFILCIKKYNAALSPCFHLWMRLPFYAVCL